MVISPAFQGAADWEGKQEGFFFLIFQIGGFGCKEVNQSLLRRRVNQQNFFSTQTNRVSASQRDYNPKMSAAMDVWRNSEVILASLLKRHWQANRVKTLASRLGFKAENAEKLCRKIARCIQYLAIDMLAKLWTNYIVFFSPVFEWRQLFRLLWVFGYTVKKSNQ